MELFTLGHDNGYTRALTGWTLGTDGRTALLAHR
ncbi:hypothetical protein ACX9NE_07810 [Mycobacterium sp. ML4]